MDKFRMFMILFFSVLICGLVTLWPSFNLALTGDDFYSKWRIDMYMSGRLSDSWNRLNYLFTDYGPQDTFVDVIYSSFSFESEYYYYFSFILRFIAALSFAPIVYKISKSWSSVIFSSVFFMVSTTGLETTDWSFNAPSYIAIFFLNFFLYYLLELTLNYSIKNHIISAVLFMLSIISQPIRMSFLPIIVTSMFMYLLIKNSLKSNKLKYLSIMFSYLICFYLLTHYTNIGDSVGLRGSSSLGTYISQSVEQIQSKGYSVLFSPVSQIGLIILPNNFIEFSNNIGFKIFQPEIFKKILIPWIVLSLTIPLIITYLFRNNTYRKSVVFVVLNYIWGHYVITTFMIQSRYPLQWWELLSYLLGGIVVISLLQMFIQLSKDKLLQTVLLLSIFLLSVPFIPAWIRNPGFLYETTGRYLIVPSAGLTYLIAVIFSKLMQFNRKKTLILLFLLMFYIHSTSSFSYLENLSNVRNKKSADNLRSQIKFNQAFGDKDRPTIYYFEGDPEVLHHVFIFGFPVIMAYQHNFYETGNIAATTDYSEIRSAYIDGKSMDRFIHVVKKVKLEDVHAYKIDGDKLIDISDKVRSDLLK